MKRFKNFLFVADATSGLKPALSKAIEMANLNYAKLTVIDIVEEYSSLFAGFNIESIKAIQEDSIKTRTAELKKIIASCNPKKTGSKPDIIVKAGKNFIEIIKEVKQNKHDLVIKVASGDFKLSGKLFSSLGMHLIRKCPCPVLIIKPSRKVIHSKILASVDLRPPVKGKTDLNKTIMELASSLAEIDKGEINVLNAWFLPNENRLKDKRIGNFKSVPSMLRELRLMQKKRLDQLVSDFSSCDPKLHLIKGQPDIVIPRFINGHGIDLVVMGTVARSGIAGFFIGNTAEKILNSVNCSVLAIKPEGFKTPV